MFIQKTHYTALHTKEETFISWCRAVHKFHFLRTAKIWWLRRRGNASNNRREKIVDVRNDDI